MPPVYVRRALISLVLAAVAVALLVCLFAQIVIVPNVLEAEAAFDPVIARAQTGLTWIGILGIACFEAVLIATAALLLQCWSEKIFTKRAFVWVDITIVACLVAALLSGTTMGIDLLSPPLPAGAFPPGTDDATSNSLLIFGFAGAAALLTAALVITVMRDLLRRAVALRVELDEVI